MFLTIRKHFNFSRDSSRDEEYFLEFLAQSNQLLVNDVQLFTQKLYNNICFKHTYKHTHTNTKAQIHIYMHTQHTHTDFDRHLANEFKVNIRDENNVTIQQSTIHGNWWQY